MNARRLWPAVVVLVLPACLVVTPPPVAFHPASGRAPLRTLSGHTRSVTSLAVSPDGTFLASSSRDGSVRLWNLPSGSSRAHLPAGHRLASAWVVTFSPDGSRLAAGSDDLMIRVWSLPGATPAAAFRAHERSIRGLVFSPDGRLLASGSRDDTIALWDTTTWTLVARLPSGNTVRALAFTPDGSRLFAGTADNVILTWDTRTHARLAVLGGHTNSVQALATRPASEVLVSGSADQTLRLWHATTMAPLGLLVVDRPRESITRLERYGIAPGPEVLAIAVSPGGRRLASAHRDPVIRLWDLAERRRLGEIPSPAPTTYALVFGPGGHTLFSGGDDDLVHEWRLDAAPSRIAAPVSPP